LRFEGDVLAQVDGDQMPSESEFVTLLGANHKVKAVPLLEASEDKLKDFGPPPAAAASAPAAAPQASAPPPPSSYPPLEPSAAR
jgi:outer membrane protein assembly factor BamE